MALRRRKRLAAVRTATIRTMLALPVRVLRMCIWMKIERKHQDIHIHVH